MSYYFFHGINQAVQKLAPIRMRMMIEIHFFLYTTGYYYNSIILAFLYRNFALRIILDYSDIYFLKILLTSRYASA